jgi:hypothetical protein
MRLVKRRPGHLPVMFLVQIAQRHRVREKLIEILDRLLACCFRSKPASKRRLPKPNGPFAPIAMTTASMGGLLSRMARTK